MSVHLTDRDARLIGAASEALLSPLISGGDLASWWRGVEPVIRDLFQAYLADPSHMPTAFSTREDRVRAVTDYIAGMTDRFAIKEHQRLTGRSLF